MGLQFKKEGLIFSLKWGDIYLWCVTISMILFGLWGFYDGLELGSPRAAWKFIFLFVCFVAPSVSVLLFFKPEETDEPEKRK
jgi:hypothetical protein